MTQAYSRLRRVLEERGLTVLDLHRRIEERGQHVNLKSLYRLHNEEQVLERLDLRVAGIICELCEIPLSDLITFEDSRRKLRRLPAARQKRLDELMVMNSAGTLKGTERGELQSLVREAEGIALDNVRTLAAQRKQMATG